MRKMRTYVLCRYMWKYLSALIMILVINAGLHAHTVYLKSGKRIIGKITSQSKDSLEIEVNGTVQTIQKSSIDQIDYFDREVKMEKVEDIDLKKDDKPTLPPVKKKKEKSAPTEVSQGEGWGLNRWTVAGRSALIPGWGHYAIEEKYWSAGHISINFLALYNAYSSRNKALEAKTLYEQNTLVNMGISQAISNGNVTTSLLSNFVLGATSFNQYQASVAQYNNSVGLLALVYLAQLGHAYYSGSHFEEGLSGDKSAKDTEKSGFFQMNIGPGPSREFGKDQFASINYIIRF